MSKLAIIMTTFLRPSLASQTISNYTKYLPEDSIIIVGDQSHKSTDITNPKITDTVYMYYLSYDCGLSFARNKLVKFAAERNIPYCLISADSIQFTEKYDFTNIIDFLNSDPTYGIVGLDLLGRCAWEKDMRLVPGEYFELSPAKRDKVREFQPVDICRNFFIAKTQCLLDNPWDNDLALAEHESFFYELKTNTNWKVFCTNTIKGKYVDYKPEEYKAKRNRMYLEYRQKLLNKYNIKGWVKIVK